MDGKRRAKREAWRDGVKARAARRANARSRRAPHPASFGPRRLPRKGRVKQARSRGALRARVLQQERKPRMFRLQINKGRRSAGRRKSNWPHHTNRCRHLPAPRARRAPRTIRLHEPSASGALAFRRSTAALAQAVTPRLNFRPRFLESPGANGRTLPVPVQRAPRATGRSTGGTMPEAARERFARPPAGTALAPLSGSHLESALVERDGGATSRDGDEGQARSTN